MRIVAAIASLATLCSAVVACSAGTPPAKPALGSSEVEGTVASQPLKSLSAVAEFIPYFPPNNQPALPALRIRFSDHASTCAADHEASTTVMTVTMIAQNGLDSGTFPIIDGSTTTPGDHQGVATFSVLDATCKDSVGQSATSGTLTLKGADFSAGGFVNGSVDVTFPGGTVSGTFYAESCAPNTDASKGPDASANVVACVP